MTNYEFEAEYTKLESTNQFYAKPAVKELVAQAVCDLDYKWFSRLVETIALDPSKSINIGRAARDEKRARQAVRDTKALCEAYRSLSENTSNNGLAEVLKSLGANSLFDAVKKTTEATK